VHGARAYAWYVAGQALWGLGYIFELVSSTLGTKIFWDQFQWVAGMFILIAFPIFTFQYSEIKFRYSRQLIGLSFIIPVLFLGLIFTDSQHHLLYPNPTLDQTVIFSELRYDFTWVIYAYAVYNYLITFTGLGILLSRLVRPHYLYRGQILTIAFGFFIPIGITMLTLAGVDFKPFRDVSPFTFAIGNLIIAWGLFRYHLFEILPIARDTILENMLDLVIVLDSQNRIIDANPATLFALNRKHAQVIGYPAEEVFGEWPKFIEKLDEVGNINTEVSVEAFGSTFFFEVKSTDLEDKRGRYLGRVSVSRDITERVELQTCLQKMNEELEERVAKRTDLLRKSEEKHRLLFEEANDAIFIMKDDVFVDCNTKTTEMFGYSREEIIGKSPQGFSPEIQPNGLTSEEMAHKNLGATLETGEPQYFEWRHIHKDGTEFDVEVSLNLLELDNEKHVQAIVRDITERKHAEKNLAEAYDTTLEGWAKALEMRDKETKDHSQRVVELTVTLAKALGIEGNELVHLRRGAILHDIGKMGIPDEILLKPSRLTISERKVVEQHPDYSYELLSRIPYLEKALDIPYCHHERWDGTGYPRGLKGEEIPLAARIFSIVDVWDAVQSERPYNHAWTKAKTIQHLKEQTGKHFDPHIVEIFLRLVEQGRI
jgi:PAS domain S-box-containing protein